MAKSLKFIAFAALIVVGGCEKPVPIVAAPVVQPTAIPSDLAHEVAQSTIVTLKDDVSADRVASIAAAFAAAGKGKVTALYTSAAKGFAVSIPLEKAQKIAPRFKSVERVEADGIALAYQDGGCMGAAGQAPPARETIPWGVARVGGPLIGDFSKKTVWVIDSGLDNGAGEITVDEGRSASCLGTRRMCQAGTSVDKGDALGHGTMIAGILAAKANGGGLIGVAPGATVVPVKIFDTACAASWRVVGKALDYVGANGQKGEVVVIGWGSMAGAASARVDAMVRALADKGMKVVVAAGNGASPIDGVSPARAGSYRASNGSEGTVLTVSAVDANNQFWSGSNWGNDPPDFAEPGVAVESLWPGGKVSTFSGTSFAAAHLAGILLSGTPKEDGSATGDPSDKGDPSKDDPIGKCCAP